MPPMTPRAPVLLLAAFAAFAALRGAAAEPVSAARFLGGECDSLRVSVDAVVADVLRDETDPEFVFLVLDLDGETVYAPIRTDSDGGTAERLVAPLVGARVRATGICDAYVPEPRRQLGRQLYIASAHDIAVLSPAPEDPFDVPALGDTRLMSPGAIARLGARRLSGKVLASWKSEESLLRARDGRIFRASFADRPAPAPGDFVEVAGRPATDVHRVNLERAKWRIAEPFAAPEEPPTNIVAREVMSDDLGRLHVKPRFLGRTVRLRGIVRNRVADGGDTVLYVEDGGFLVPVRFPAEGADVGAGAEVGSVVEATGVCVLDIENWRPDAAFPQIKGFFVVARDAGGIRVVSRPPWWTAGRLFAVIGILLAAVAVAAAWSLSLRALAERRGRALLRSRLAQAKASLKVVERTRLAAELHDSLAQNLTGVSMEIGAAKRLLPPDAPPAAVRHLEFAANAIDSSRDELRNCLWDLRGSALDEPDMERAVELSVAPRVGAASLSVRFPVPRAELSDALAHAALRIVRELAVNAVRHGGAKSVAIEGRVDGDRLVLRVSDDGCGFDPESAPGIDQGHFGLQGIRERADLFAGTVSIDSAPGRGTRVTVALALSGGTEDEGQ